MNLSYTFAGVVEDNKDPMKLGRLKVRVPHVYGTDTSGTGYIGTNDLPWALPVGLPAGGSSNSGGLSILPEAGDKVFVRFLDGEPEKPIWEWGMQSQKDASNLKLHHYASSGTVGSPDRAIITRYGHSLEISKAAVNLTTSQGYQLVLENSTGQTGGSVTLVTPAGQKIAINDLNQNIVVQALNALVHSAKNVLINASGDATIKAANSVSFLIGPNILTIQQNTFILTMGSGAAFLIDEEGNMAAVSKGKAAVSIENDNVQLTSPNGTGVRLEDNKITVSGQNVTIDSSSVGVGQNNLSPVMILTEQMKIWLTTHTHSNGNNGSPTGPPIVTDGNFPTDGASTRLSAS